MTILERNFFALSLMGVWRPVHFTGWKSICYTIYNSLVFFELSSFVASAIIAIMTTAFELHSFIQNVSLTLTMFTGVMKVGCLVYSRRTFIKIKESLEKRFSKAEDNEERMIYERYKETTRNLFNSYTTIILVVAALYVMARLAIMEPTNVLPFIGWFPYDYSSQRIYWFTVVNQVYSIWNSASTNSAFDPLLPTMQCYICAHVNILKHRFNTILKKVENLEIDDDGGLFKLETERKLIGDWVEYHIEILDLVQIINTVFTSVVFVQYFCSAFVLCSVAYLMSHDTFELMVFIANFTYLAAMTYQIFFQCGNANQLTVEFSDMCEEIGTTNWFSLSHSAQKCMVIILAKAMRPIIFSCGFFLNLSLESFMKLVKLSYTVYNVLE